MKCSCDAERSFSAEARHFVMKAWGVTAFYASITSLSCFAIRALTTCLAGISTLAPVAGFRPMRRSRCCTTGRPSGVHRQVAGRPRGVRRFRRRASNGRPWAGPRASTGRPLAGPRASRGRPPAGRRASAGRLSLQAAGRPSGVPGQVPGRPAGVHSQVPGRPRTDAQTETLDGTAGLVGPLSTGAGPRRARPRRGDRAPGHPQHTARLAHVRLTGRRRPLPVEQPATVPVTASPAVRVPEAIAVWDDNRNGRVSCAEARAHGIAPVTRDHSAYPFMRDGDGDGVVCETGSRRASPTSPPASPRASGAGCGPHRNCSWPLCVSAAHGPRQRRLGLRTIR